MDLHASKTLLLVEDEALIALDEKMMLERHGYRVKTAHTGEKAVQAARKDLDIDLVLMDIDLGPGIDGTEAALLINESRELPIVFLSSHTEPEIVARTEAVSSYGFVGKQSGQAVIIASIRVAFRLHDAHVQLRRREQLLQEVGEMASVGGWEVDTATGKQQWTPETYRIHRLSPDFSPDVEDGLSFFPPESRRDIEEAVRKAMVEGIPYDLELRFVNAAGEDRWIRTIGKPRFQGDKIVAVSGAIQDITYRKNAELALLRSRQDLQEILGGIQAGVVVHDRAGRITHLNTAAQDILGITEEQALGRDVADPVWRFERIDGSELPPEEYPVSLVFQSGDALYDYEYGVRAPNEHVTWVLVNAVPLYTKEGTVGRVVVTATDISTRRRMEEKVREIAEQRSFLMRELNHRVKNNLAMVSSLIGLKDAQVGGNVDLSGLMRQIDAIRTVHDMLSGKEDAKEIQLSAYLGDLVQAVFSLAKRYVQVKNTVGTIRLETQRAIPVGLIVNELATNALKHAFTDDGEARISLDLRHDDETDEFVLTFENTGNPFPEGIDLHNPTSTGLGLIAALVEQLNGSIEVRRAPITAFVLRFPHDPGRRFG